GEIVFIIGGNGSGKSTFVKLLVGLYTAHDGDIKVNSLAVKEDNLKRHVAVVFSDPYLFTENYSNIDMNKQADRLVYLTKLMRLEKVIAFPNGEARIDGDLSSGQHKRLALMNALLEDKPILVLDEWAAEQDPEFRKFFYFELLPLLRKEGKTIIAIT
ncbi:MAG: ATP-binding cassette domain-containing protein, partial [Flammeovirgaceae bacterium]